MAITRKAHTCKTEGCGSIWYTKQYEIIEGKSRPVWKCVNCNYHEPRKVKAVTLSDGTVLPGIG